MLSPRCRSLALFPSLCVFGRLFLAAAILATTSEAAGRPEATYALADMFEVLKEKDARVQQGGGREGDMAKKTYALMKMRKKEVDLC